MAIDKTSGIDPSIFSVFSDINSYYYFYLKKGVYVYTYSPTFANLTVVYNYNGQSRIMSYTDGYGYLIVGGDTNIAFKTDTSNTEILIASTPSNIVAMSELSSLEKITTTSTYSNTGTALKLILIGGGQAGATGTSGPGQVGGAGGSGGRLAYWDSVPLPGSVPVSVGAGGTSPGGAGGNTTFGSYSSASGTSAAGGTGTPPASVSTPGTPSEPLFTPTGVYPMVLEQGPVAGGPGSMPGVFYGKGGGQAAGGGGGRNAAAPFYGGSGGGGGGGISPGSDGATGFAAPGPGGAGGAGGVFILRVPQ